MASQGLPRRPRASARRPSICASGEHANSNYEVAATMRRRSRVARRSRAGSAPPTPSSRTEMCRTPSARATSTYAADACACFAVREHLRDAVVGSHLDGIRLATLDTNGSSSPLVRERSSRRALQLAGSRKVPLALREDRCWLRCGNCSSPRSFREPNKTRFGRERTMEPILISDAEVAEDTTDEELLIHAWCAEQLRRLGLPRVLAETSRGSSTGTRSQRLARSAAHLSSHSRSRADVGRHDDRSRSARLG